MNTDKDQKSANLSFYHDGFTNAQRGLADFSSLTPLFKAMQSQYSAVSRLTQSFAMRTHREERPIQCEKGCEWCCYQPVYMTTQEAILIFEFLHQSFDAAQIKEISQNVNVKYKKTKGLKEEQKQKILHACPFLKHGICSIYSVRPMACRIYLSANKESCKKKFDSNGDGSVVPDLFDFILKAGRYMNEGFVAFLKGKGKQIEELTIEEFMSKLFNDPEFVNNWLKDSDLHIEESKGE